MTEKNEVPRFTIGKALNVAFDTVAWGPAAADVDLSVACMFEHEADGTAIAGGLLALDQALGGLLTRMRSSGAFRCQEMETLLVSLPPAGIPARAVLVIQTDGEENSSRKYASAAIKQRIHDLEKAKGYEVIFLGQEFNGTYAHAAAVGTQSGKTVSVPKGMRDETMSMMACKTRAYAVTGQAMGFSAAEKTSLGDAENK